MAIDLLKLEKKFIDLFENTTQEEFEQWLLTKTKPMAQQTAVEWLAEKYIYINWMRNRDEMSPEIADKLRQVHLEQAKAMFQEQIMDAWWYGNNDIVYQQAEEYYNDTYLTIDSK
jgi:hypothetical protein